MSAGLLTDVFASHGLRLNFLPGKSEAVFVFRGAGSVAVDRLVYRPEGSDVEFECKSMGTVKLVCSRSYVHLGMVFCPKVGVVPDITHKVNRPLQQLDH